MDRIEATRCQLVLVDYQARLMPAIHDGGRVVQQALLLAGAAYELGVPTLGTEQNPGGLGTNVEALRRHCAGTLTKMHFDACEDGLLEMLATQPARPEVVIAGCEAHVCLLQTGLGLRRAGHRLWVAASACGSRREADHLLAMQRLRDAGATIVSSEMVAFEWLQNCTQPNFKAVLAMLKETA